MPENTLYIYAIYHVPEMTVPYVAKCFYVGKNIIMEDKHFLLIAEDIEQIRDEFRKKHLTMVPRMLEDDEKLVETWM